MYIKYCTLNILKIKLPSRVNKTRNIFCCYLQWQSHSYKDHPINGWGWNLSASRSQRALMLEALGSLHLVKRIDNSIFWKLVSHFLFPHTCIYTESRFPEVLTMISSRLHLRVSNSIWNFLFSYTSVLKKIDCIKLKYLGLSHWNSHYSLIVKYV